MDLINKIKMDSLEKNFGKFLVYLWSGVIFIAGVLSIPLIIMFFWRSIKSTGDIGNVLFISGLGIVVIALVASIGYVLMLVLFETYKKLNK